MADDFEELIVCLRFLKNSMMVEMPIRDGPDRQLLMLRVVSSVLDSGFPNGCWLGSN